jgi:hypothetical protein
MADDDGEWLDVAACAARRGVQPGTWRAYVSRGQAPAPDDPDDADPTRPVNHRRPRWRPETLDNFAWPGQGRRTPGGRRRRAEADRRRAELAEQHDAGEALQAWLHQHHRALVAAAGALVDQRDALVAAAGGRGAELAAAIDLAGEHMLGRPSRSLAAGVAYALALVAALPGGLAGAELGQHAALRDGYEQVRDRSQLRQESGNET